MTPSHIPTQPGLPPPISSFRAFVGAKLDPSSLEKVVHEQSRLANQFRLRLVRWMSPRQIHLTLYFFGNLPVDKLDSITTGLADITAAASPVALSVRGTGFFPSTGQPRIIWFGLKGDLAKLQSLQDAVQRLCRGFGSHFETKNFHPHLTIGRVRPDARLPRELCQSICDSGSQLVTPWLLESIQLVQSDTTPAGSQYITRRDFPLRRVGAQPRD